MWLNEGPVSKPTGILIVDDHPGLREELQRWLEQEFPASNIFSSATGEEAWDLLDQKEVQLVLMDINLPGKNGIEWTARIKSAMPDIAVIILTIYEDAQYRREARNAGANSYILKRDMYSDLIGEINQLMDPGVGSQRGAIY